VDFQKLEYYISQPRIDRFLTACGQSKAKAQKLYRINVRVAQAFYPILNLFETFLRNSIHNQVSGYFTNSDWIIHEKAGFMSHPSLAASRFYLRESVRKAERTIQRKGGVITSGKVVAEQVFGFWTSLFEPHHYSLIGGVVIHCFPNKPSSVNRSQIAVKLNGIREFRNRVYHNEPLCFNSTSIDFAPALAIKQDIYELLGWMDTDLVDYIAYFDSIDRKTDGVNNL